MDYLCLTVLATAGESESAFKSRLTVFWSHLIRAAPDAYAAVYAEATHFGTSAGRVSRAYIVAADAAEAVSDALTAHGVEVEPVDADDTYTKYEVSGSEWFQIDH